MKKNFNPVLKCDVCIIGGNIAGSNLAYLLAENGLNVIVVEQHKETGVPLQCAGIISKKLLKLTDIEVENKEIIKNQIKVARLVLPDDGKIEIPGGLESPLVVDRIQLDKHYYNKAIQSGANFLFNEKFITYSRKNINYLLIKTNKRIIKSKIIVGCDGPHSNVAKLNGVKHNLIFGAQITTKYPIEYSVTEMYFDPRWKDLFGWIIPEGNGICRIGFGCYNKVGENFRYFLNKLGISKEEIISRQGGAIPLGYIRKVSFDRTILLGDSACMVKATTGGGVVMLLNASKIAKNAIIKAFNQNDFSENLLNKYYEKSKKMIFLKTELKVHYLIRLVLERFSNYDWKWFIKLYNYSGIKKIMQNYADMDFPKKMIFKMLLNRSLLRFLLHFIFRNPDLVKEIIYLLSNKYILRK